MRFDVLTIFPDLLESPLREGILRRARQNGQIEVVTHDLRDYALDRHATTDDRPFGGGEGMVMKPEPIVAALEEIERQAPGGHVVILTPRGRLYDQDLARELATRSHLVLVCGRYEGIDERVHEFYADEEISIGDYVLTGGELAAMVLIDSVTRLLPGVLGCEESATNETFSRGLLKHPQYTRPRDIGAYGVPEVLLSGDHQRIAEWRLVESVRRTLEMRPDLVPGIHLDEAERAVLRRHGIVLGAPSRSGNG